MNERVVLIDPLKRDFIRLLTDFGFKRVFGSKEHAELLRRFLNALFEGEMYIERVEFKDKELQPIHVKGKKVQYDIYCTADDGKHFILEMQQEEAVNFSDRILFYISKAIVDQGAQGVEYVFDPVYCIVITDFNLPHLEKSLHKDFRILDSRSHEQYSDKFRLIFLSLKELPREWEECDTELKRLLYLIKNMENLDKHSAPYLSGAYNDFFTASMTDKLTADEAVAYSQSYLKELEIQSTLRFTANKNREEGLIEGEKKGLQKGLQKGRKEGREEGRKEGLLEGEQRGLLKGSLKVARNLLKMGMSIIDVASCTDLPEADVIALQNSL